MHSFYYEDKLTQNSLPRFISETSLKGVKNTLKKFLDPDPDPDYHQNLMIFFRALVCHLSTEFFEKNGRVVCASSWRTSCIATLSVNYCYACCVEKRARWLILIRFL